MKEISREYKFACMYYDWVCECLEEDEKYELTLEKLLNGIKLNTENRPDDCDIDDGDANTMDCIIQYGLFGDIIFG